MLLGNVDGQQYSPASNAKSKVRRRIEEGAAI